MKIFRLIQWIHSGKHLDQDDIALNEFYQYALNTYGELDDFELVLLFHILSIRGDRRTVITDAEKSKISQFLVKIGSRGNVSLSQAIISASTLEDTLPDFKDGGVYSLYSGETFKKILSRLIDTRTSEFLLHFDYEVFCSLPGTALFLLGKYFSLNIELIEDDVFIACELRESPSVEKLVIDKAKSTYKSLSIESAGDYNYVFISPGVKLPNVKIKIQGSNNFIFIGRGSEVKGRLHIQGNNSKILIGDNAYFTNSEARLFAQEDNIIISIGKGCLFGKVLFRTSDSHSIFTRGTRDRINPPRSIVVKDKVWMAEDIKVFKGVVVEEGVIVAANSLVVKSLSEPYSIYGGSPAKVIKRNVEWSEERV